MLWILLTAAAAPLQVARNALQRGLVGDTPEFRAMALRLFTKFVGENMGAVKENCCFPCMIFIPGPENRSGSSWIFA